MAARVLLSKGRFGTAKKLAGGQRTGFSLFSTRHASQGQSRDGARSLSSAASSNKIHWRHSSDCSSGSFYSERNLPRVTGSLERTTFGYSFKKNYHRSASRIPNLPDNEVRGFVAMNPEMYELRLVSSAPHAVGDPIPSGFSLAAVACPGSEMEIFTTELDEQMDRCTYVIGFVGLLKMLMKAVELEMQHVAGTVFNLKRADVEKLWSVVQGHLPALKDHNHRELRRLFPLGSLPAVELAKENLRKFELPSDFNIDAVDATTLVSWLFVVAADVVFRGDASMMVGAESCLDVFEMYKHHLIHCYEMALQHVVGTGLDFDEFGPRFKGTGECKRTLKLLRLMMEEKLLPEEIQEMKEVFEFSASCVSRYQHK